MNKVFLIGNLTRDPERNQTANGVSYCRFGIAVNRNYANANGERETDFFNIITWRAQADSCYKYLRKGLKVGIVGSVNIRNYEQDGVKRSSVEISADEVEFLSPKGSTGEGGGYETRSYDQPASAPAKRAMKDSTPVEDEDLPF